MTPRNRIVPVFVPHLGCPNDCVFCNQRSISGSPFSATAEETARLLRKAREVSKTAELAFYGGSFTAVPEDAQRALLASAQPFRETGFITAIRVSTRPDAVSREKLEMLKDYGVKTVELGAQSMDERVLRLSGRGHSAGDTRRASALVKETGLCLILQMMTGLPGADPASDLETARQLAALRPDGVRIYPTVILRGTPLEELWRSGKYRAHSVREAVMRCAPIVELFRAAGIPILRLGLNHTEDLSAGEAVAGAYHPALGELVYGKVWLERARAAFRALPRLPRRAVLLVPEKKVSVMTGQRRCNLLALRMEFGLEELRVTGGQTPAETVAIRELL